MSAGSGTAAFRSLASRIRVEVVLFMWAGVVLVETFTVLPVEANAATVIVAGWAWGMRDRRG